MFTKKSYPARPTDKCGTAVGRLLQEDYNSADYSLLTARKRRSTRRAGNGHSLRQLKIDTFFKAAVRR